VVSAAEVPEYKPHPDDLALDNEPTLFESLVSSSISISISISSSSISSKSSSSSSSSKWWLCGCLLITHGFTMA